jgi:hypothetical protein
VFPHIAVLLRIALFRGDSMQKPAAHLSGRVLGATNHFEQNTTTRWTSQARRDFSFPQAVHNCSRRKIQLSPDEPPVGRKSARCRGLPHSEGFDEPGHMEQWSSLGQMWWLEMRKLLVDGIEDLQIQLGHTNSDSRSELFNWNSIAVLIDIVVESLQFLKHVIQYHTNGLRDFFLHTARPL